MGFVEDAREQAVAERQSQQHSGTEYRVDMVREKVIADQLADGVLERLLNDRAGEGWTLNSITATDVQGGIGGSIEGLLVVFERPAV